MTKRRLWVVSELYYPEQTSTGYFLTRIAEGLADDYEVHAVCGQPSYSERGTLAPAIEQRHGTVIHRLRSTHFDKDRLVLRAINFLTFTLSLAWFGLWHFRTGDRILAVTNPPTTPFVVGLAAKIRRARTALLVHDVYPEVLAATGVMQSGTLAYRLLARAFSAAYGLFDALVVLGRDMQEVVRTKLGRRRRPVVIIPNWGDVGEIAPIAPGRNAFRSEHGLADKFVVQFSGNIGRSHDVELLLAAAALLRDRTDIVFLFIGYGGKAKLVDGDRACNVRFLPRQPRERLGEMLGSSDATAITFVDGMYGISVPSRMYNIMAAGVPTLAIADPRSELALTVAENGAGWVLADRTSVALADLIRDLASEAGRAEAKRRGRAARAAVERDFTLPRVIAAYRALFAQHEA